MTMPASPIPAKVRCYGCGAAYNPLDDAEHHRHTHHTGAAFGWALRPRRRGPLGWLGARQKPASPFVHSILGTAAGWLDKCQVERDVAIRAAASLEVELARYDHGVTRLLARRR